MATTSTRGRSVAVASGPLTRLFKALADEHRLRILQLLHERGELSVTVLSSELKQSQPAVSHHLIQLRQAGLIDFRRDGKFNYYHLDAERLKTLLTELSGHAAPRLNFAGLELRFGVV